MKLDLPIPTINVMCDALRCLQQHTAVALADISQQVQAQQAEDARVLEEKAAKAKKK